LPKVTAEREVYEELGIDVSKGFFFPFSFFFFGPFLKKKKKE